MKTMYPALLKLMMDPVVPYSSATSGVADRTLVLETGERKAQNESTATMSLFLALLRRLYTSSPVSQYLSWGSSSGGSRLSGPDTLEVVRNTALEGLVLMGCISTGLVLAENSSGAPEKLLSFIAGALGWSAECARSVLDG